MNSLYYSILPSLKKSTEPTFLRLFIDTMPDRLEGVKEHLCPMVFFAGDQSSSSMWHQAFIDEVIETHVKAAETLAHNGHKKIILAADNDGLFARMLSPRFSDWPLEQRMKPLLDVFTSLKAIIDDVWVLLTIEELMPGGMDATDGVAVARALEANGLTTIVVASGSKDFMPLFQRKMTKRKLAQTEDFCSHEPSLASALWVRQNTTLTVWVRADVDDEDEARTIINYIGAAGIMSEWEVQNNV